ncbi:alkaline phosphatase D family protein [Metabacillus sp. FJAT-52054]|uniref:Alkaline phosphatase D family protein n=1 Tax=Metabacillus sediminis TaxID=3117746 RepID=A0ABZ2NL59_9BACI
MRDKFEDSNGDYDQDRRKFLKYFLAGSAVVAVEASGAGRLTGILSRAHAAETSPYVPVYQAGEGFPQAVLSGDPTESGAMIWTRVDPVKETGYTDNQIGENVIYWLEKENAGNENLSAAIEAGNFVMFEVSRQEDFSNLDARGFSPIWKEHDQVVRVDLDGFLESSEIYYYRFITKNGYVSQTGRFQTLPKNQADIQRVKLGYVSCQDYTNGHFTALGHLADEDLAFFLHVGDYIYESVGDAAYQGNLASRKIDLPSGQPKASSLEDYRTLYKKYRTDPNLQKLHSRHAMIATWDDHEFANDTYYPAVAPDDDPNSNPERRLVANQAWYEYMPARVPFNPEKNFEESIRIYRSFTYGNLAKIIMTDQRLYRSSHPCGEETLDRYLTRGCENVSSSERTMLGASQLDWFLNELKTSNQQWKLWGNEVQLTQLKILGKLANLDAWDGYTYERDVIAKTITDNGISNLIALTGDFHTFEASVMRDNYGLFKDEKQIGVELMVGSVTSSNLRESIRNILNKIPDPSSPMPANAISELISLLRTKLTDLSTITAEVLFKELQNIVKIENPWIKLFDSTAHGYAVLEVTKEKSMWTAYKVDNIEKETSKKELLWQCEVPNGKAELVIHENNSLF